jgi:hypothetical protein
MLLTLRAPEAFEECDIQRESIALDPMPVIPALDWMLDVARGFGAGYIGDAVLHLVSDTGGEP